MKSLCALALLWAALLRPFDAPATPPQDLPKPRSRTTKHFYGWTIQVDDRLLDAPNEDLGRHALALLKAKLMDIEYVMAKDHLQKLKSITIVLDLTHGRLRAMQYHPSASWLEEHRYSKDLAKCVHIPQAADFATARQVNEQPWVVLHELAHAYHDQVLGFDDARIRDAYEKYKHSGHGESTLLYDGTRTRHYALTDPKEFFAEFTETYFGVNDFFPFNRAELKNAEPEIYALMVSIWGPIQTGSPWPAGAPPDQGQPSTH
ncbi:MAG TPA: metallopeptidase [Verrucomicrobiae bacterium]|nr:metallopeptidase [Verrucomicrobiae bacterium]